MNDNNNESNSLLDMFGTSEKETPQQTNNASQQSTNVSQQTTSEPQQNIINTPVETPQPINNTEIGRAHV